MMVICTMIRMLFGVMLRTKLMKKLDRQHTAVKAAAIVNDVSSFEVTASAEQMPST